MTVADSEGGSDSGTGAPRSSLARSSTVMAIGTVASRGTGFVRTVVLAAALLWSAPALAQSASGPLDFLGNIFGGKSRADQTGPAPSAQPASTSASSKPIRLKLAR